MFRLEKPRRQGWGFVLVVGLLSLSQPAAAVDSATRGAARKLAYEGVTAYQRADYPAALSALERAYAVMQVPSLALWSARALEKSGKLVEASERYLEATKLPVEAADDIKVQEQAKVDATKEREALLQRVPSLTVQIEGADSANVKVTVNGVPLDSALLGESLPTNPGAIEIVAQAGEATSKQSVTLAEAEGKVVVLKFGASAPAAAVAAQEPSVTDENQGSTLKPALIYGGFGLGAVGIATGTVTGILAMSQMNTLKEDYNCDANGVCDVGGADALSSVNTLGVISTIGFGVAAVGVGLGIYGLLMDDPPAAVDAQSRTPQVGVLVGATNGISLAGKF